MSPSFRWLAAPLLVFAIDTEAHADACLLPFVRRDRPPLMREQPASPEYDFVIVRDPNAKQAELRIPRAMMVADASSRISPRHAMAGLALSAAFVGGGLWCMRYRAGAIPRKKVFAAVAVGLLLLSLLTAIDFAAATPPQEMPGTARVGEIDVNVVIVPQGDVVELVVSPEFADKLAAR